MVNSSEIDFIDKITCSKTAPACKSLNIHLPGCTHFSKLAKAFSFNKLAVADNLLKNGFLTS